jgi:hypothetical protein
MTETMLERMARAMYEAEPGVSPLQGPQWEWSWMMSEGWSLPEAFRNRARAALEAIREPDEAMMSVKEVDGHEAWWFGRDVEKAWPAMIDAILSQSQEGK